MTSSTKLILEGIRAIIKLLLANNRMLKNMQHAICPQADEINDPMYDELRARCGDVSYNIEQYIEKGAENE